MGDRVLLDDISHDMMSPTGQSLMDSVDLTYDLNKGVHMDGLPKDKAAERRRRRKERKLRKLSGYNAPPSREQEVDLFVI